MQKTHVLRIATRKSVLAMKQSEIVKNALIQQMPELTVEFVPLVTKGDQILDRPLAEIGGKGLFIKELEVALLENRADIAVHSMKDMAADCAPGLALAAFLEREDPRDVFVSNHFQQLSDLPTGAKVGTSSPRRTAILKHLRPDLSIQSLRGNLPTRLNKLDQGDFDAIILAAAGLHRLGLQHRIQYYFSPEESLPAIGQGIIGIECRQNDEAIQSIVQPLNDFNSQQCVIAERMINQILGGNCHSPIAAFATINGDTLNLKAWVLTPEGKTLITAVKNTHIKNAFQLGKAVAEELIAKGVKKIL